MDFGHPKIPSSGTAIVYDPSRRILSVSTHANPGHDSTPLSLRAGEALSLRVFVDGNLIEVVANGRASLATSVPDLSPSDDAVRIAGSPHVEQFDAWVLKGIWGF